MFCIKDVFCLQPPKQRGSSQLTRQVPSCPSPKPSLTGAGAPWQELPSAALAMLAQGTELRLRGTGSTGGMGGPEHSSAQDSCSQGWRSHSPLIPPNKQKCSPPNKQKCSQQCCQHLLRLSSASSVRIKQKADATSSNPGESLHTDLLQKFEKGLTAPSAGANHPNPSCFLGRVNDPPRSQPEQSHPKITWVGADTPASPSWAHGPHKTHVYKFPFSVP